MSDDVVKIAGQEYLMKDGVPDNYPLMEGLPPSAEPKLETLTEVKPTDQMDFVQRLRENTDKFLDKVGKFEGSRRQLQAVLAALMVHPFNEKPFQFGYPDQKELFDLGNLITSDKLCLFHLGILEEQYAKEVKERALKEQALNKATEEVIENYDEIVTNKETENG